MAGAPAYSYNRPERSYERRPAPSIRVLPSRGRRTRNASPQIVLIAKLVAVGFILVTALCFVRIGLVSATVSESMANETLSSQVKDAASHGNSLEIQTSQLVSPSNVQSQAAKLGLSAPTSKSVIDLSGDVVATDEAGNLSLALGAQIAVGNQA
ncbi:MAG: cell division protein FtsL [Eggerthellaceae bacterium]|jgi:hypothetical protein